MDETLLTTAALGQSRALVQPGPGRVLVTLSEVELGVGRPDVLLLTASKNGLLARARHRLRLGNLTEAEILAAVHEGRRSKHTASHVRAVTRRLRALGWLVPGDRLRMTPRLISQSVLIEAKVRDWRTGIGQLARTTWVAERSALLVPRDVERRVPKALFQHNGIGLIVQRSNGALAWRLRGRSRRISLVADLWVTELAIRHLERGVAASQPFLVNKHREAAP
ncbi:MAG: hypothetical protein M3404_01655 [Actinomycetota bacterium]|nr:hypothetical protein [Actinomycetota bacterium]